MGVLRAEKSFTTSLKKYLEKIPLNEGVRGGNAIGGDGDLCAGGGPLAKEGEQGRRGGVH